ncbi:MAG: hypothetical protein P8Z78_09240 [Gammaproteobacteria bacterium]|jgi:hypothetical protein
MKKFLVVAIPMLLAVGTAQAEWNWPWENDAPRETGNGFDGFFGDFFGGERTHLDFDVDTQMQMRYDMNYVADGYSRYAGSRDGHESQGLPRYSPYYDQPAAVPPDSGQALMRGERPSQAATTDRYRVAIEAQRRMVEQTSPPGQNSVPHFDDSNTALASSMGETSDPEAMFRELEERRAAAFRGMEERRRRHAQEYFNHPVAANGPVP